MLTKDREIADVNADEDELARQALLALCGIVCECGQHVLPRGREMICPRCRRAYCPFCGRAGAEKCPHLLAHFGWPHTVTPLLGRHMPRLERTHLDGLDWSRAQKRAALGRRLYPCLAAGYDDPPRKTPRRDAVTEKLLERAQVTAVRYSDRHWWSRGTRGGQ